MFVKFTAKKDINDFGILFPHVLPGDTVQMRLLKCLIPAGIVPVDLALRVVSFLSTENISVNVQVSCDLICLTDFRILDTT